MMVINRLILLIIETLNVINFKTDDDEEEVVSGTKWCEELWEGTTHKKNFGDMTFKQVCLFVLFVKL